MNLENDILIEKYLRKELSSNDEANFFKMLENDTDFKEYFLIEKQLFQTLNNSEWSFAVNTNSTELKEYASLYNSKKSNVLKKVLKQENNIYQRNLKIKSNKKYYYFIAAAIVILFLSIANFVNFNDNPKDLYAYYLSATDLPSISTRGNENSNLVNAQKLFKEKKYDKVLSILKNEIKNKDSYSSALLIYVGVSQVELNKNEKAINTFNKLINSNLLDSSKGYWFKALVYLKSKNVVKAKETLLIIASNKSNYKYKEAKSILEKLE